MYLVLFLLTNVRVEVIRAKTSAGANALETGSVEILLNVPYPCHGSGPKVLAIHAVCCAEREMSCVPVAAHR